MDYVCKSCGETHEGLPRDIDFGKPGAYLALSPQQQKARCRLTPDICTIGKKRFFIHGKLPVPVQDAGGAFVWGVWAEVSPHVFVHYQQVVANAEVEPLPSFGSLSVEHIPPFRGMDRLPVMMRFVANEARPTFTLEPSNHWLCRQQQNGITLHYLKEMLHGLFPQHF
jgi:hypothetical protein